MPFFRNKNKLTPQEDDRNRQTLPPEIGEIAVGRLFTEPEKEVKSYAQEVNERVVRVRQANDELVKEAIRRGVGEEELPSVIADAMNAGVHPKIVQGMTFKGSGVSLTLLDGHVPAEALSVHLNRKSNDSEVPPVSLNDFMRRQDEGEVTGGIVMFSNVAKSLKGDTFTYEDTGNLPQHSQPGDPVDMAMLAKIDAHLPDLPQPESH